MRLLLTNFHPGCGGGHTTYLMEIFRGLGRKIDITLASPATSRLNRLARESGAGTVVDMDFPGKIGELPALVSNLRRLRRLIADRGFDVIHVNGSPDHRLVMYAGLSLGRCLPAILTKHNSFPVKDSLGNRLRARLATSHVIAVSRSLNPLLAASPYGALPRSVVPNGVNLERFAPWSPERRAALRRERGFRDDQLVLVSVSGTALHKGWHLLLEAMTDLPPEERARLAVVVCGHPPSAEAQDRCVARLGLEGQVRFPGFLADVREEVAAADAGFVLSTGVETISFACREMMAMGKPVLVSDYGGLAENVNPCVDGWVVPAGDVPATRAALAGILGNPGAVGRMGAAARARAEAEFSLEGFLDATEAAYRRVAGREG